MRRQLRSVFFSLVFFTISSLPSFSAIYSPDATLDVDLSDHHAREPVVLIPPLLSQPSNVLSLRSDGECYKKLIYTMTQRGWRRDRILVVDLPVVASNVEKAEIIRRNVDMFLRRTHAKKVDMIAYSSGALSSRWYIRFLNGFDKISEYVSFSATHHGTPLSYFPQINPGTRELIPGSRFLQLLNAPVDNTGRETFGDDIHYFNILSKGDGVHIWTSQLLNGAYNIIIPTHWWARINHNVYAEKPIVIDLTLLALDNDIPGIDVRLKKWARDNNLSYDPQETEQIVKNHFANR